jgi:hypothetical protein
VIDSQSLLRAALSVFVLLHMGHWYRPESCTRTSRHTVRREACGSFRRLPRTATSNLGSLARPVAMTSIAAGIFGSWVDGCGGAAVMWATAIARRRRLDR